MRFLEEADETKLQKRTMLESHAQEMENTSTRQFPVVFESISAMSYSSCLFFPVRPILPITFCEKPTRDRPLLKIVN